MSGWRQDQYLDQAYHAMALQPAHSAVTDEGKILIVNLARGQLTARRAAPASGRAADQINRHSTHGFRGVGSN